LRRAETTVYQKKARGTKRGGLVHFASGREFAKETTLRNSLIAPVTWVVPIFPKESLGYRREGVWGRVGLLTQEGNKSHDDESTVLVK